MRPLAIIGWIALLPVPLVDADIFRAIARTAIVAIFAAVVTAAAFVVFREAKSSEPSHVFVFSCFALLLCLLLAAIAAAIYLAMG